MMVLRLGANVHIGMRCINLWLESAGSADLPALGDLLQQEEDTPIPEMGKMTLLELKAGILISHFTHYG
jgi:hypothetical protein